MAKAKTYHEPSTTNPFANDNEFADWYSTSVDRGIDFLIMGWLQKTGEPEAPEGSIEKVTDPKTKTVTEQDAPSYQRTRVTRSINARRRRVHAKFVEIAKKKLNMSDEDAKKKADAVLPTVGRTAPRASSLTEDWVVRMIGDNS